MTLSDQALDESKVLLSKYRLSIQDMDEFPSWFFNFCEKQRDMFNNLCGVHNSFELIAEHCEAVEQSLSGPQVRLLGPAVRDALNLYDSLRKMREAIMQSEEHFDKIWEVLEDWCSELEEIQESAAGIERSLSRAIEKNEKSRKLAQKTRERD